jgi:hypothetical protein
LPSLILKSGHVLAILLTTSRRPARFSDSILRFAGVRSFAGFLVLGCFFGPWLAAGAAAASTAGSIASAFVATVQIWGKGFRGRRVACVPLAGGTIKLIGRTREDTRAVRADANLAQIWTKMRRSARLGPAVSHRWSVRSQRSRSVGPIQTPTDRLRRPTGDVIRTESLH